MLADRGRASKACAACRRQKTRCYASNSGGSACLRCETLRQPCSLAENGISNGPVRPSDHFSTPERLTRLENAVNMLFQRLDDQSKGSLKLPTSSPIQNRLRNGSKSVEPPIQDATAPIFAIRDLASEMNASMDQESGNEMNGLPDGLLSDEDVGEFLGIFQSHYGRWIRWEERDDRIRTTKSSVLLCVCCLIAVRHTSTEAAAKVTPQLFDFVKKNMGIALLSSPQPIEFFQTLLILSMWSTTVGGKPYSVDSWLLTGFALQHAQSSNLFSHVLNRTSTATYSKRELDFWCVFNHLCLSHLHYCVGTRRKAMIGSFEIQRCRDILMFDEASNFESRMVAEIHLYWKIYEYCLDSNVDLPKTQAELYAWKHEWDYVLQQPRSQFLQMGFHFAQLLAYERALKARSTRVRDALLAEMVRLCSRIMDLAMDTADDRNRHLSDHICHMITFAAVTLSRLLSLYEAQLKTAHDIDQLDATIWKLADWLGTIGLPCHAAHTLGDIVGAVQAKLRPQTVPQVEDPAELADWPADSLFDLPSLLGAQVSPGGHWDFLPDWESLYQGPLT